MTYSIRQDFHTDMATTMASEIQYKQSNYYYFLGKVETWGVGDIPSGSVQVDSDLENTLIRANSLFMKKISPNDVSLVTARHDWVTGTTFKVWDHTKNMRGEVFYCLTTENKVFKCLDNNGNSPSTVMPVGNSLYTTLTGDGYTWKYMYTVPTFKQNRFMSANYLPVQKSLSNSFYNKGAVDRVVVTNPGTGYTDTPVTYITVTGSTTGSGAVGTITVGGTGNIATFIITNGGTGYTQGVDISFTTTNGTGAVCTAVVSGGVITGITIVDGGVGYSNGESIVFSVGGAIIVPSVSTVTGSITKLTIVNPGTGYTGTPTLTITGTGTGKYGNSTALFTSVMYQGKIVQANITDPGINYSANTSTTITVSGDGSDAAFSPIIYNGEIIDVVVENAGVDYTSLTLHAVGTGTGAVFSAVIYESDYTSTQSVVEQTAVIGAVYSIQLSNPGNNYSGTTVVTVTGDGTGCTATPTMVDGAITKITITNPGSGYTYGVVSISDVNRGLVGTVVNASAYIVLPPSKGHGFDAVSELYGETLAINSSLRQETSLNSLYQDYRQFGIIKNPTNVLTSAPFTGTSTVIAYTTVFTNVVGLLVDEVLVISGVKFRVVSISGTTVTLQQLGTKYLAPIGTLVAEVENTRVYNSFNLLSSPVANKYSGKLLYVSNEDPFSFTEDQGIVIKTFLKF
jgi:hypothetical protein